MDVNLTLFTRAPHVVISPPDPNRNQRNVEVFFRGKPPQSLEKYLIEQPWQLETDGAVIESRGQGGITLEIIDFGEFKSRFHALAAGSHFCELKGVGTRACIQLRRIVTAASCTPARKFLASLS
jgi:hypothetical protein